jgi:hypothetical protein
MSELLERARERAAECATVNAADAQLDSSLLLMIVAEIERLTKERDDSYWRKEYEVLREANARHVLNRIEIEGQFADLRAEIERLRPIEQAARKDDYYWLHAYDCPHKRGWRGDKCDCGLDELRAALDRKGGTT